MELRSNARYALACPTSMGLRITPENRMAVQSSNLFYLQATSAESNVLNVAASLGRECLVLTKFVQDSPMAELIRRQLRARHAARHGELIGKHKLRQLRQHAVLRTKNILKRAVRYLRFFDNFRQRGLPVALFQKELHANRQDSPLCRQACIR